VSRTGPGREVILASASPRRRELLARLGLEVRVVPAHVDETPLPGEPPPVHALRVARAKLEVVASAYPDRPVLAADTVVTLGARVLGKPRHAREARTMLQALAGRTHLVLTAVAVGWQGRRATHLEAARVAFAPVGFDLLDWYVASGEGADKAGSYALQGAAAAFIPRVEGNVQAIVGLPLAALPLLFSRVGLALGRLASGQLALTPRAGSPRPARTGGSLQRCGAR
jgi:septum formation protein